MIEELGFKPFPLVIFREEGDYMSEIAELKEHFEKLIGKIKHHHDVKEHEKSKVVHIVQDLEKTFISALEREGHIPELDLDPFDALHTEESKPFKTLVHDTAKAVKKIHKNYIKEHPEEKPEVAAQTIEELQPLHIKVEEKLSMHPPTPEQEPNSSFLEAALSKEIWNASKESIIMQIDHETSIIKLAYLVQEILTSKSPFIRDAQEAIIQECGRKMQSPMQLTITDLKPLKTFIHFLEYAAKHIPTLAIPLHSMLSGVKNLLGD